MRAAHDKYRDQGFEVLSVSIQEGDAEVVGFIEKYGLDYQFLMDRTGGITTAYGVATTPTTYFVAPDGTVVDGIAGVVSRQWLEDNITAYVTG